MTRTAAPHLAVSRIARLRNTALLLGLGNAVACFTPGANDPDPSGSMTDADSGSTGEEPPLPPDADTGTEPEPQPAADTGAETDSGGDTGPIEPEDERCLGDRDCDDGVFCNGAEQCEPTDPDADDFGCVTSSASCRDDEVCVEDEAACVRACDYDPDVDDDGELAVQCGGTDCNDADPSINSSAAEVCDGEGVDEDCNPETVDEDSFGSWNHCTACGDSCAAQQACESGACVAARRVFLSSSTHDGDLGGALGGDSICQELADAAQLGGIWRAYLIDTHNGLNRHAQVNVPYIRLDGVRVADGWGDLADGSVQATISIDEWGRGAGGNAWTGMGEVGGNSNGDNDCADWTFAGSGCLDGESCGYAGETNQTNEHWDGFFVFHCSSQRRLYCIEQ